MNVIYTIETVGTKGKGIICQEAVKEGAIVYTLSQDTDIIPVSDLNLETYLQTIPDVAHCLNHGFSTGDEFIDLTTSVARFTNHSFTPSTKYVLDQGVSVALRDLQPGDEITENYWEYSLPPNYDRLMKLHVGGNFREQSANWT